MKALKFKWLQPQSGKLFKARQSKAFASYQFSYTTSTKMSFYDLSAKTNKGETLDFSTLKGKVVLIVNTASKCGFTPQYDGLEALYKEYKDKGLEILGFPCNQFGSQEPGDDKEIASFCQLNHGVTFPLMEKIEVNGDNVHPVYEFLKSQKAGILGLTRIKWNFEKFLINKEGKVQERYSSMSTPESLMPDIEKLLA
ncbi:Glutathione peroxidase 2 [Entomophthora muscae]|uniref:Glutathione peroxidase 2 n=1 Tax=Entomophthora muscae TaxID=34485 RepID=A0ACC2T038_9FUNG|nr:Glutathione peroxidase 2 [Entomophthora muscae]